MILVTVGAHPQQFNRLINEVDRLVYEKKLENVVVQIGHSDTPKYSKYFRFLDYQKMNKLFKQASIVITHGGIGSVLLALRLNKPTIIVPRRKEFGEHTDDHQLEISRELEKQRKALTVYDIKKLSLAIDKSFKPASEPKNNTILITIDKFLKTL